MTALINRYTQRRIFFEGNSLMNNIANANVAGGHYVSTTVYNNIIVTYNQLAAYHLAKGGQNTATINSAFATRIQPYFQTNDIYVIWEGLNSMRGGSTGAQAYADLVTCCNNIKGLGGKIVVGTVTKSNFTGDPAGLATEVDAYNALVIANQATICDAVADIGANPNFDQVSDTTNATYYIADKLHLATGGQNLAASIIQAAVETLL